MNKTNEDSGLRAFDFKVCIGTFIEASFAGEVSMEVLKGKCVGPADICSYVESTPDCKDITTRWSLASCLKLREMLMAFLKTSCPYFTNVKCRISWANGKENIQVD